MAERIGPDTPSTVVRQARNAAWECLHAAAAHIDAASRARASLSEKRRRARQRAEREAAGLCIQCGREPARPGRKTGEACAERARTRRDYRRRFPMPPPCGHCSARPAMGEWCALADMSRFDEPDDRFVEPEDCQRWQATAQAAGFPFEALKRCGHCGARPIADYCGETLRETRPDHFEPPPLDNGPPYAARFPGNCKRWQAAARRDAIIAVEG